jgi:hypothetical protein
MDCRLEARVARVRNARGGFRRSSLANALSDAGSAPGRLPVRLDVNSGKQRVGRWRFQARVSGTPSWWLRSEMSDGGAALRKYKAGRRLVDCPSRVGASPSPRSSLGGEGRSLFEPERSSSRRLSRENAAVRRRFSVTRLLGSGEQAGAESVDEASHRERQAARPFFVSAVARQLTRRQQVPVTRHM